MHSANTKDMYVANDECMGAVAPMDLCLVYTVYSTASSAAFSRHAVTEAVFAEGATYANEVSVSMSVWTAMNHDCFTLASEKHSSGDGLREEDDFDPATDPATTCRVPYTNSAGEKVVSPLSAF